MSPGFPFRIQAAVVLAALLSLWGTFAYFGAESEHQKQIRDPDQIAAQAVRLAGVRSSTPDNAELGYITDVEPGGVLAQVMFNGAAYVLAPRLLHQGIAQDWVLGNFSRPADFAAMGRSHGLRIERDLGSGAILFRKENGK